MSNLPISSATNTTTSDLCDKSISGLREYIEALRESSDRSRYALYTVIVATVLVFVANWNIQPENWPLKRLDTWFSYARGTHLQPPPPKDIAHGDPERLKAIRDEYVKQFAARAVLSASPIPGVSIDVNDLGLVGGIALILLMAVLVICGIREHENVYLALYKVRIVAEEDRDDCSKGDSRSNLLYHALAMTQVLNSPPTLAKWERHGALHYFWPVFFVPFVVYAWVMWTNFSTRGKGATYGIDMSRLLYIQGCALLFLFLLSLMAALQSRAMARRWERVFLRINPHRGVVRQMTFTRWLKLGKAADATSIDARTATAIVDGIRSRDTCEATTVEVAGQTTTCAGNVISRHEFGEMLTLLARQGRGQAKQKCKLKNLGEFHHLERFTPTKNVLSGREWSVAGKWAFRYVQPQTSK